MAAKSFQELQRARQQTEFIGRSNELLDFRSNLDLPLEDPRRRFIFGISGQGGMGKTTLLARYRDIASTASLRTSACDEAAPDVVTAIEKIGSDLNRDRDFDDLLEKVEEYRSLRHRLEADPDAPDALARLAAASAGRIGTKLARRIPVAGVAFDFVDPDDVGDQLGEIAAFVMQRTKRQEDAQLLLDPIRVLSPLLVNGIASLSKRQAIGLFFDTFEETQHAIEPWLLGLLDGDFGELPLNFIIAIAGRLALDPNQWGRYEGVLERMEMEPFSQEEARKFLAGKGITDEKEIEEILRLSHCVPILLVSMAIGKQSETLVSSTAVERVLRSVPEPLRKVAMDAAVPRLLNRDVARLVLEHPDVDAAFDWLISMPFIHETVDGWKYHDVIRQEFLRYGRRESPERLVDIHTRLADHYSSLQRDANRSADPSLVYKYGSEQFYHGVSSGNADELVSVNNLCMATWDISPNAARLWAVPLKDAEDDSGAPSEWGALWIEAIDQLNQGHDQPVVGLMSRLLSHGKLKDRNKVLALLTRSDLYYWQGRYDAALDDIQAAIALEPSNPRLWAEQAWIHLHLGDASQALGNCEEALTLSDREDRKALSYGVTYVQIANELFDPEDTIDLIEAVLAEDQDSWGLLVRGKLHRRLGAVERAIQDFRRSMELAVSRTHAAQEQIGRTLLEVARYDEAAEAFEEALKARWDCAECWRDLARAVTKSPTLESVEKVLLAVPLSAVSESTRGYRAVGLISGGAFERGIRELEEAVREDADQPEFRLWLARAKLSSGLPGEGLQEAEEALKLRPEWPAALVARGLCCARLGDHAGALDAWERAEKIAPSEVGIVSLCDRGLSLSIIGRYEDAVEVLEEAMTAETGPEVAYNRAVALARLHGVEHVEAQILEAEKAVSEAESSLVRAYGGAGIYALRGKVDDALLQLESACEVDRDLVRRWATADPAWSDFRTREDFVALIA